MSAKNSDKGGQREHARAESKRWNAVLRAARDVLREVSP
jgi:hypothetical protein